MMNATENQQFLEKRAAETQTEIILDLENDNRFLNSSDLTGISEMFVYDEVGNRHRICDLWKDFKTIFVFVRSFLCFTAKEYVEDLALIPKELFKEKQVRLIVIGCAHWKHIRAFRKLTKFPYFIFCDIDKDIYNKLGMLKNKELGNNKDSPHVKSTNFRGLLSSTFRAMSSTAFDYQGGLDQQGGSIVVGPGNVLHFSHLDKHGRDHMPINVLLKNAGMEPFDFNKARLNNINTI